MQQFVGRQVAQLRTHFPDYEPTSLCSYLLMQHAKQRSSKYQFYSLWFDLKQDLNPRSATLLRVYHYTIIINTYCMFLAHDIEDGKFSAAVHIHMINIVTLKLNLESASLCCETLAR
jgi:hypothetical protein